ncbi:exodeoxyribonuclease VII small subunit [Candidatus Kapabacteria bacterium]|nr:exodeoxyribonuclease VII small subunit [Candidatus Kapabacteria bacterium]
MTFEEKIKRLDEIASLMEDNETSVEQLVTLYEEGMKLSKEAKKFLDEAEQKIIDISSQKEFDIAEG